MEACMRQMFIGIGLAALLFSSGAAAQDQRDDEIVVHAQRTDEAMRAFIGEVTIPQSRERQIARWDRTVCLRIVGLATGQGQFIADQIARRTYNVGLRPGADGCTPNVLVFFANDSDAFTRDLVARYRVMFDANNAINMSSPGAVALQDFTATPRAVRWWHVAQTVTADGQVVRNAAAAPIPDPVRGFRNVEVVHENRGFSRLARMNRQDFQRAVVIVDANRVRSVSLQALGDYLAMTTLAQLDMNANVGDESILGLFAAQTPPTALTAWDISYLDGLYHAPRNARTYRQQEGAIAARMHSTLDQ
jgi:hypothetical protein